jgi:N-acetylglucosaminyldiphosphoundecaprenol N-acetyl-beta-D-mannosaminyltransferase
MKTSSGPRSDASGRALGSVSDSRPDSAEFDSVVVAGIRIANLTESQALDRITRMVLEPGPHYMVVVNASKAVAAQRDEKLREIVSGADLVTADGMSVVWGSWILGKPLMERVTGIDVFERLTAVAAAEGLSVYLLGASQASVQGVIERIADENPTLRIAGFHHGYFKSDESTEVAQEIRRSGADLLFVAMGTPVQEYWIHDYLPQTGAKFALGVGGAFDHVSRRSKRAPRWMQRSGLEWLYRLLSEPRRLWRRYLFGNTRFMWLIISQALTSNDR